MISWANIASFQNCQMLKWLNIKMTGQKHQETAKNDLKYNFFNSEILRNL